MSFSKFTQKNRLNEGKRIPAWMKDEPELIKFAQAIPSAKFEEDYDEENVIHIVLPLDEDFDIQFYYYLKSTKEYTPSVFTCVDEYGKKLMPVTKSADKAIKFARKMLNDHASYNRMYCSPMTVKQAMKILEKLPLNKEVELTVR